MVVRMIKRQYFMSAKCVESSGYCYMSTIGSYSSILSDSAFVFDDMSDSFKKKLLAIRPNGHFEVVSFNRV